MPSETIYARMHKDYLRKNHPEMYSSLKKSGELLEHCRSVGKTAINLFETISAQMATSPNLPTDYQERVDELESIPLTVEEIVLHDVVYSL